MKFSESYIGQPVVWKDEPDKYGYIIGLKQGAFSNVLFVKINTGIEDYEVAVFKEIEPAKGNI